MKIVFQVVGDDGFPVTEQKSIPFDLDEATLQEADGKDAAAIAKANAEMGENFATLCTNGRGKVIRTTCDAIGIIISKSIQRDMAIALGDARRFELLDEVVRHRLDKATAGAAGVPTSVVRGEG